jgi:hypothetical protein
MTDGTERVMIWLGTQDIPPIQVWAPRKLGEQGMLSLLKLTLGVTMEHCWFGDNTLNLKGGEEFIISRNGWLHSGYLDTDDAIQSEDHHIKHAYLNIWEVSETQDPADEQAELAAQSEVIENEETARYELNDSDGYCRLRTLSIKPTLESGEIWTEAERRLRIDRSHFALVVNSHYLPKEGLLDHPVQLLEIRFRGREGGPADRREGKESLRDPRFQEKFKIIHDSIP